MAKITKNKDVAGNDQAEEAKEFGLYLKELRKSHKLNQADLAQRIEVTAGYYGIFEQGRQIPSLKIINRLAQALDIDYLELAMRAGYDELEARKKEMYRPKDPSKEPLGADAGDQGDREATDEAGSGVGEKTNAGTHTSQGNGGVPSIDTPRTSLQPSSSKTEAGAEDLGLSLERLDWALGCISRDPTYKLAEQFKQGELSRDVKVLVVQLYQAQTQRQLLTAEESLALSYTLHG